MFRCIIIICLVIFPFIAQTQSQSIRAGTFELSATPVDSSGHTLFCIIEHMPEFPGGLDSLYSWLKCTIKYPTAARRNNIEGSVFTSFVVDTTGIVTNIKTYRGIYPALDSVCFFAVKNMPVWTPGFIEDKPVRVQFLLPVRFVLTCDSNCVVNISVMNKYFSMIVPESMVSLSNSTHKKTTYSDFMGSLQFDSLLAGQYQINIVHPDYQIFDTLIEINRCTSDFTFYLRPLSDSAAYYWEQSEFNAEGALRDIKNNNMRVLLPGGIIQLTTTTSDSMFEKKYNVHFLSQGCVRLPGENQSAYNQEIFKYLDLKFGQDWRREIRSDAIGLE